jgi:hypothetical protein
MLKDASAMAPTADDRRGVEDSVVQDDRGEADDQDAEDDPAAAIGLLRTHGFLPSRPEGQREERVAGDARPAGVACTARPASVPAAARTASASRAGCSPCTKPCTARAAISHAASLSCLLYWAAGDRSCGGHGVASGKGRTVAARQDTGHGSLFSSRGLGRRRRVCAAAAAGPGRWAPGPAPGVVPAGPAGHGRGGAARRPARCATDGTAACR